MSTPYIFELILSVMIYTLLSSFELIERNTQMNSYLLVIILVCFAFVGIARVAQPDLIAQTFSGFFKVKRPDSNGFEGSKLQPSMSALIVLNYIISFSTCVFLPFSSLFSFHQVPAFSNQLPNNVLDKRTSDQRDVFSYSTSPFSLSR